MVEPVIRDTTFITKKGYPPVPLRLPEEIRTAFDAAKYYESMMKLAGFKGLVRSAIFSDVCQSQHYEYPAYLVDEVGFKLSKRKERPRPNQLCRFVGLVTKKEQPNLHLTNEAVQIEVDVKSPQRILDYIRRDVKWA